MSKHWPLLLLLLIPVLMFPGAIPGERVVSADDHLSVHHAYQTEAGGRVRHPHLSDPALQFKSLRVAIEDSVTVGEIPFWNPAIWAGAPLLGDAQSMVGSPVTWIHLLLPPHIAPDVSVAWLLLWVGLGSALLVLSMGGSPWGATIAGAAAMTNPYMSVWLLHPHAATAVWLPWILLGLSRRSPGITAIAVAGLLMGGHPETAFHVGLLVTAALILHFRWWQGACWMAVGLAVSAPIWLPFVEEVHRSATLHAHGGNTLQPLQLLDLLWPGFHGHPAIETWDQRQWSWADGRIHPGIATLLLAAWSLHSKRHRWLLGLWLAALVVSVAGMPGPLNHARLAGISSLLIAISAGTSAPKRWAPLALAAVVSTGIWAGWHDQGSLKPADHDPPGAPWTEALKQRVQTDRVIGLDWALQPNTGALVGLRDLRGYDLPVSTDTERMQMMLNPRPVRPWFRLDEVPPTKLLQFLAVKFVLSPNPLPNPVDLGPAPLYVTEIPERMGRVWAVTAPRKAPDAHRSGQLLLQATDPISNPPVEGLNGNWPTVGTAHAIEAFQETPNTIRFRVDLTEPSVAIVADSWHPGWSVTVNGDSAKALRVGGIVRGVQLPAGPHHVAWTFKPQSWPYAWIAFWLGLFALMASAIKNHFRQSKHRISEPKITKPV